MSTSVGIEANHSTFGPALQRLSSWFEVEVGVGGKDKAIKSYYTHPAGSVLICHLIDDRNDSHMGIWYQ